MSRSFYLMPIDPEPPEAPQISLWMASTLMKRAGADDGELNSGALTFGPALLPFLEGIRAATANAATLDDIKAMIDFIREHGGFRIVVER